jgi:hypothetical protein
VVNRVPGRLARFVSSLISRPRCSRLHAGLPVRRSGFDSRWALAHARVADRSEAPAFQAGEAGSIPAACSVSFCREGWHPSRPHKPDPVGSIPTPATFQTRSPALTVGWSRPKGSGLISRATDRREARALVIEGRIARWQTACRTSASRRSPGGTTAERCLSSVDGDVPGPYPGEDRSNRSRGSARDLPGWRNGNAGAC